MTKLLLLITLLTIFENIVKSNPLYDYNRYDILSSYKNNKYGTKNGEYIPGAYHCEGLNMPVYCDEHAICRYSDMTIYGEFSVNNQYSHCERVEYKGCNKTEVLNNSKCYLIGGYENGKFNEGYGATLYQSTTTEISFNNNLCLTHIPTSSYCNLSIPYMASGIVNTYTKFEIPLFKNTCDFNKFGLIKGEPASMRLYLTAYGWCDTKHYSFSY